MEAQVRLNLPPMQALAGSVRSLSGGEAGTRQTLRLMWNLMQPEAGFSMPVYAAARQLTANVRQKDYMGEARALFRFVQNNIRYIREPIEGLQTPEATLQLRAGDCDDKTILLGALLIATGARVKLVAGGHARGQYSHVWLRASIRGRWVPMDPTEPHPMGWEPPLSSRLVVG